MPRALVIAARQPEFSSLLEDAGFDVDVRTRPLDGSDVDADVGVVFRGRLIGRNQAATLASQGIPVVEVLTVPPTTPSTARWIRISNRIAKPDLVQIVLALADSVGRSPARSAAPVEPRMAQALGYWLGAWVVTPRRCPRCHPPAPGPTPPLLRSAAQAPPTRRGRRRAAPPTAPPRRGCAPP
jgi:hypothetical protein